MLAGTGQSLGLTLPDVSADMVEVAGWHWESTASAAWQTLSAESETIGCSTTVPATPAATCRHPRTHVRLPARFTDQHIGSTKESEVPRSTLPSVAGSGWRHRYTEPPPHFSANEEDPFG